VSTRRTRARFRRIPETMRRAGRSGPGGSGGGLGGGGAPSGPVQIVGLNNFSAANSMITAVGGGEAGVATGFGAVFLMQHPPLVGSRFGGGWNGGAGYTLDVGGTSYFAQMVDGGGTGRSVSVPLAASDVGRLVLYCFYYDGTNMAVEMHRGEVVKTLAVTGYGPWTTRRLCFGGESAAAWYNGTVLGMCAYRGTPTLAQRQAFYDAVRTLGDIPTTFTGATITRRASVRAELAGTTAVNGQTGPAQLSDTVTLAPVDAYVKVGSPTVRIIDPSVDGRRTLGAQGFSSTADLRAAVGAGILGSAAGHFIVVSMRFDVAPTGAQDIVSYCNASGHGWQMYQSGSLLRFFTHSSVGGVSSAGYTVTAPDIGIPILLIGQNTGTGVHLYVCRAKQNGPPVQTGADSAISGYTAPAGSEMRIGSINGLTQPFVHGSVFAVSGGSGVSLALAEVTDLFNYWDATGRLPATPKTQHLWEISTDVLASGVDAVPATVLDRVGTDHLTRVGVAVQTNANAIRGVGPYGAIDVWQTAPGGGVQGAASGYHLVLDVWWTRVPASGVAEVVAHCANSAASSGYVVQVNSGALRVVAGGVVAGNYTITSADLNRRTRVALRCTGVNIELLVNGVQITSIPQGSFVANTNISFALGSFYGAQPFTSGVIEAAVGGNTVLSAGDLTTYFADITQAPPTIPGVTLKRYVFEQDIAAVAGALPVRSAERITGNDDMVRSGSGLTLAQRTERVWSYETSPVLYGANALTDTDYYGSTDGVSGHVAGAWFGVPFVVESQAVASQTRTLMGKGSAGTGWALNSAGTNSTLGCVLYNGVGAPIAGPVIVIAAADVGKQLLLVVSWDGAGKIHAYVKRAESGTGATMVGFTPALVGDAFRLGRHPFTAGQSASGIRILGCMGGVGVPSLAEVQAAHDAFLAADDIVEIPGKTDYLVSLKQDVLANGGALPATLINRKGAGSLTKAGAPLLAPIYARAAGW
jgi:hypothetical protein